MRTEKHFLELARHDVPCYWRRNTWRERYIECHIELAGFTIAERRWFIGNNMLTSVGMFSILPPIFIVNMS